MSVVTEGLEQSVNQPASLPASWPASQTANQLASLPASGPVNQSACKGQMVIGEVRRVEVIQRGGDKPQLDQGS